MDKVTEVVKRVTEMEEIYDQALKIMDNVENSPEEFLGFQNELMRLADYYSSQDWKDDFALDEEGKLPQDLKRGVLSEDGVYNLLERNKELLKERGNEGLEEADETLDQIFEMVKDYPDLLQKLVDAQNDYANKLECMVEATKQQLAESGEDILSDDDSVALETLQYKAKGELCEIAEQLLREAFLRKQETYEAQEKKYKELESEYRRLKKMETRYEVGHKVYPNDPCPCGSGKKYKKCCGKV